MNSKKIKIALLCGMLGCVLMGTGDWLMLYGDPTITGTSYWLTEGAAHIPAWRNALSMALGFPATVFYGIGLFGIGAFLLEEKQRKTWFVMNAFGLTPWLCVHIFVAGALFLFAWLRNSAPATKIWMHSQGVKPKAFMTNQVLRCFSSRKKAPIPKRPIA